MKVEIICCANCPYSSNKVNLKEKTVREVVFQVLQGFLFEPIPDRYTLYLLGHRVYKKLKERLSHEN